MTTKSEAKKAPPVGSGRKVERKEESKRAVPAVRFEDPGIEKLREIVRILEGSELAEIRYEDKDVIVELSRHAPGAPAQAPPVTGSSLVSASAGALARGESLREPSKPQETEPSRDVHVVRSPFIGTFYSAPQPGAEPFTDVGRPVRKGQTLCIIEAMKLMNEIESEVDGTVLEALAENGKAVQYGDALFKIKLKGT